MDISMPEISNQSAEAQSGVDQPNYVPVGHDFTTVTEKISALVLRWPPGLGWLGFFGISNGLVFILLIAVA